VPGAELCKTTEEYADYWKRGAREADHSTALICMEQAINGWKNLAYDLARQVHYAMRAGYIDDPRAPSSAGLSISDARIKELVRNVFIGVNCPDVSSSECIEYAIRKAVEEATSAPSATEPLIAVEPGDLLEVLRLFANANWPDTKAGNAAFRIANKIGERWTQFRDGVLTDTLHQRPVGPTATGGG
jgi:hypothetical protein